MFNWQERLASKDQKISENFYATGHGTVSCDWPDLYGSSASVDKLY